MTTGHHSLPPVERFATAQPADAEPAYTIATLVNRPDLHAAMLDSFRAGGFGADCEAVVVREPGCAYRDLNRLLAASRGRRIILCHQDVRLVDDGRAELDQRLAELDASAPGWALAGVAGGMAPGRLALRISDPHGRDQRVGAFPARVQTLDECFIVLDRDAGLRFSADLTGFHLYGADLCLHAEIRGRSAWVVDFHLEHLSAGRKDATFRAAEAAFRARWSRHLSPRWLQTTCTLVRIGRPAMPSLIHSGLERLAAGVARRLAGRGGGWRRPRRARVPT